MAPRIRKLFNLPKDRVERIYFIFLWIIRLLLIGALILEGVYQQWEFFFVTAMALFLTLFPSFLEKQYQIKLPPEFNLFIVLFLYAGIYLGEVQNFYYRFLWWDTMLHTLAGFALGIIGVSIMFILYKGNKINANPSVIAFFGFCFATTLSVIWEIFEFLMDSTLGMNMQKVHIGTGVTDTMIDLIVNAIGALVASLIGWLYLKYGKSTIYHRFLEYFMKKNPQFSRKNSR